MRASVLLLLALPACVIYDEKIVKDSTADTGDTGDTGEATATDTDPGRPGGDTDTPDTTPTAPAEPLVLTPPAASPGDTVIVSLVSDGTYDLSHVSAVALYTTSDVTTADLTLRNATEALFTVTVAAGATPAPADLLVSVDDGAAAWAEGAFRVVP